MFGVAGSGDVYYQEYYNLAVDKFTDQLSKTGAKQGAKSLKINLAPEEEDIENLDKFSAELINKFKNL